jgi:predicted phosphodiesterase
MDMKQISRRRLMKMSAGALLAAGIWPGALAAQDAPSPDFSFLVVNDLHYVDTGCVPFFSGMVQKMKAASPDSRLLLVVGDTCENGTPAQLMGMREILKTTSRTIKVVIGNHDWASDTERKTFDTIWPDSLNYTFDHNGWQLVALDTTDGTKYQETSVLKPTLDWLDKNLPRLDKKRPMILYTHFPLGQGVNYCPKNAEDVLNRFKEYNLRAVFNGHYHAATERKVGDYLITTGKCCSYRRNNHDNTPEKGFLACKTQDGKVIREFVEVSRQKGPA